MSAELLLRLRERIMTRPKERNAYIDLLRLALSTRIAVTDCLRRIVQEKDEEAKGMIRSEAWAIENRFEQEKQKFLGMLQADGIDAVSFTYGDMCNTMLP